MLFMHKNTYTHSKSSLSLSLPLSVSLPPTFLHISTFENAEIVRIIEKPSIKSTANIECKSKYDDDDDDDDI